MKIKLVISILFLALISGCGGSSGGGTNSPTSELMGKITGQVINGITGEEVAFATVRAGEATATTDVNGNYTLQNVIASERVVVRISAEGFAGQSKIARLPNSDSTASLPIKLLPIGLVQTFNPDLEQTLSVENSPASVQLTSSSLVQADGSLPMGDVTVNLTVIDPTIDIEMMPGDMLTDVGGVLSPIESFGAITVTFTDAEGNDLNLAQDSTATIRIPLADKTGSPPPTIPLYFYDEINGLWKEEGFATLMTEGTESYYEGTVSHFSTWNADILYDQVLIHGCITDSADSPISGATVVSVGDNYSGTSSAVTDALGNFSIIVKPDASVLIFGLQLGAKTNTIELATSIFEQTLESCLLFSNSSELSDTAVSIKLSWGELPADLDSHLVGPEGIKVFFMDKGDLVNFPFIHLDVDDTDSFGPEVITIFNFSVEGTYRYSVHNFSRFVIASSSGITASPTRVELNVNGNITLYIPPVSEGVNVTWDVFEFEVASDGSFVVNDINAWSLSAP